MSISSPSTPRSEFWAGVRATVPLIVGVAPFGLIFGALAVNSGLSLPAAAGRSAIVLARPAQLIAAGLVDSGGGAGITILPTHIANLSHPPYRAPPARLIAHLL